MSTTLNVTGRPAQMGRGVLADVSGKLVERFAANLAEQLTADAAPADGREAAAAPQPGAGGAGADAPAAVTEPAAAPAASAPAARKKEDETLDLLGVAAGPVMRRIVPAVGALLAALFLGFLARLRRKRKKA
jgi:hypothetical protein